MKLTPEEFDRYLAGQSTEAELKKINDWLAEEPEDIPASKNESKILDSIWMRLEQSTNLAEPAISLKPERKTFPLYLKIAACIALVICGIWFLKTFNFKEELKSSDLYVKVITKAAEHAVVDLPDGSKVTLNANSELEYPKSFSQEQRTVKLQGEAFFEVSSNKEKPFIILTDSSYTKVLGTKFNLKAYPNDDEVELKVLEGKVLFGRPNTSNQVVLTKGMLGLLAFHQPVTSYENTPNNVSSWKDDILEFNNSTLKEVVKILERRYNKSIQIDSKDLKSIKVTGQFKSMPLEKILKSLAFSVDFQFTIDQDTVRIYH